jgi:carbamoyltransferase
LKNFMSNVLGISAFYHDAAACLIGNGKIIAAAQEERFTRIKFDPSLPINAIKYCLNAASLTPSEIDLLAYYEDPAKKLNRIVTANAAGIGDPRSIMLELETKADTLSMLKRRLFYDGPSRTYEHHLTHAAYAYYASGFRESAILVADGVGEWSTTSLAYGSSKGIEIIESIDFPHSLGLFYSAITAFLGFKPNSDEYKIMGLAPYGNPKYVRKLENVLRLEASGHFKLALLFFDFNHGMFSPALGDLLGLDSRLPQEPLTQSHADVARSAQFLLEQAMVSLAINLRQKTSSRHLCLSGGVALNCVANSRIRNEEIFSDIFVPPGCGDEGGAIGAAYLGARDLSDAPVQPLTEPFLGPEFSSEAIAAYLSRIGLCFVRMTDSKLITSVVSILTEGGFVGWFQGRMEFGPRALGARSILADPRFEKTRDELNSRVKWRENFRPFAPICLVSESSTLFETNVPEPYMTFTTRVKQSDAVPAITHVDGTARLQTIEDLTGTRLVKLLSAFKSQTGIGCLLNTSFNVAGEPIVCTPQDAFLCFREAELDALVIEDILVIRAEQNPSLVASGSRAYFEVAREPRIYYRDTYTFT